MSVRLSVCPQNSYPPPFSLHQATLSSSYPKKTHLWTQFNKTASEYCFRNAVILVKTMPILTEKWMHNKPLKMKITKLHKCQLGMGAMSDATCTTDSSGRQAFLPLGGITPLVMRCKGTDTARR